jgi:hypothetical protein
MPHFHPPSIGIPLFVVSMTLCTCSTTNYYLPECSCRSTDDTGTGCHDDGDGADPAVRCVSDGFCDSACPNGTDPDCSSCSCDRNPDACNTASYGSTSDCSCDPNCTSVDHACGADDYDDTYCNSDPDREGCGCDYYTGVCESADRNSTTDCPCDVDCDDYHHACVLDSHCDTWCPIGADPDCVGQCDCDFFDAICEAATNGTDQPCDCDADCGASYSACQADGHCDDRCDPDEICGDPDCSGDEGQGYLTGECDRF